MCVCVSAHVCLQDCTKCEAVITRTATNSNKSAREWEYASQRMLTQTPYLYTEKEAADIVKECVAKGRSIADANFPNDRSKDLVLVRSRRAGAAMTPHLTHHDLPRHPIPPPSPLVASR